MENSQTASATAFQQRIVPYLKEWPSLAVRLVKSPDTEIPAIPTQGSYERPLVYAGTAGLVSGLWGFFSLVRYAPQYAFTAFLGQAIGAVIALFVAGFVLNLIFSVVGKDPGLYRTIQFISIALIVSPMVIVLQSFVPILAYAPMLLWGYVLYKYAMVAAGCTKKQAGIMIGVLLIVPALSMIGAMVGASFLMMGTH